MENEVLVGIGDLHGHYIALQQILESLNRRHNIFSEQNILKEGIKLVFTGDYIDRGEQGLKIIERIRELQERNPEKIKTLFGNHELLALAGLDTLKKAGGSMEYYRYTSAHGGNGGDAFIMEFGLTKEEAFTNYLARMSREGDIGKWMRALEPGTLENICNRRILFVHGGVPPKIKSLTEVDSELKKITQHIQTPTVSFRNSQEKYLGSEIIGAKSLFWDRRFPDMDDDEAIKATNELGIDYIVIGHTPSRDGLMRAYGKKIFNIDIGMTPRYGGNDPGAIVINQEGIFASYYKKGEKQLVSFS